jgi:hypothetical protein
MGTATFRATPRNIAHLRGWNSGCDASGGIGAQGVEGPRISSGGRWQIRTLEVIEDGVEREAGGPSDPLRLSPAASLY